MPENLVQIENAGERDRFIDRAIDSFLDARTGDSGMTRHIGVTAYVGSELSQNNRRGLSTDEREAVAGACADKMRIRFGGST